MQCHDLGTWSHDSKAFFWCTNLQPEKDWKLHNKLATVWFFLIGNWHFFFRIVHRQKEDWLYCSRAIKSPQDRENKWFFPPLAPCNLLPLSSSEGCVNLENNKLSLVAFTPLALNHYLLHLLTKYLLKCYWGM